MLAPMTTNTKPMLILIAGPYRSGTDDEPERLVMVWEDASYVSFPRNTPAPANYYSWKEMNRVFTGIAATRGVSANLTTDGQPEQVLGRGVTSNFFSVLGVSPMLGRTFTEDEDRTGAQITLISYGLWQRRYAGNPEIVGSEITMNGSRRTVVGVMPRGFVFRNPNVKSACGCGESFTL